MQHLGEPSIIIQFIKYVMLIIFLIAVPIIILFIVKSEKKKKEENIFKEKNVEYPEHEKLQLVVKEWQVIGEFLEWLPSKGIAPLPINTLLSEYFKIDLKKLEAEKLQMLQEMRKQNQKT